MSEFRDKIRSIGIVGGKSRDRVVYGRRDDGERTKQVIDAKTGSSQTYHTDGRVDAHVKAPAIRLVQQEVRDV